MSTINLTKESAIELLAKLGADVALVDNPEEATQDVNFDEIVSNLIPSSDGISAEEKSKIESALAGRMHNEYRGAIASAVGISRKDLEGLDPKDLGAKIKETFTSRYVSQNQDLASQVEDLTRQLNAKESEFEEKKNSLERDWQTRFQERDTLENVSSILSKIPKNGDTTKQSKAFLNELKNTYDVRFDATSGKAMLYVKNTDDLVMDGKNPMDIGKLANDWVKDMGFAVTDTSNVPPAQANQGQGANFNIGAMNQPAMGVADMDDSTPSIIKQALNMDV